MTTIDIDEVKKSFGRCTSGGNDLISAFYDRFLASHPAIGPRFAHTDFAAQKALLRQGINLAIMHAAGVGTGTAGLTRIRESHSRAKLDIPPDLYRFWKQAFLQALEATDPRWTPELRAHWDAVARQTVDFIAAGY